MVTYPMDWGIPINSIQDIFDIQLVIYISFEKIVDFLSGYSCCIYVVIFFSTYS